MLGANTAARPRTVNGPAKEARSTPKAFKSGPPNPEHRPLNPEPRTLTPEPFCQCPPRYNPLTDSPPFIVANALQVGRSMVLGAKWTDPSANRTFTPLGWKLAACQGFP